jgi:hypothetical protein
MKNAVLLLALLAAVSAAGASRKPAVAPANSTSAVHGCSACREKRPVVDPSRLDKADKSARPAYEAAKKHPATIDAIHCYCGCEQNPGLHHVSLLTCFTNEHAIGCEICRKEAVLAGRMKDEGSTDEETREVVESLYRTR